MSSDDGGGRMPCTSASMISESRMRTLEEKQKFFEQKKRKRHLQLQLDDQADALAWEAVTLQYQEEELLERRQSCVLAEQKLADDAESLAHMGQNLNAEREKLAEMERTFDVQKKRLASEEQHFKAKEESLQSLERGIKSRREKLVADEARLVHAQQTFTEDNDSLAGHGDGLDTGSSKRPKHQNIQGPQAETVNKDVDRFPATPSSSNFQPLCSDASAGTEIVGSPRGEARIDTLEEITVIRGERQESHRQSPGNDFKDEATSDPVVEAHKLAIMEKGKRLKKPIEDTGRNKYKAADIPSDPRTAIPEWMKNSIRVNSFAGLPLVREIGQYVGEVDWFGEIRALSALLAYMTGTIREPCTNCKSAAEPGTRSWCKNPGHHQKCYVHANDCSSISPVRHI